MACAQTTWSHEADTVQRRFKIVQCNDEPCTDGRRLQDQKTMCVWYTHQKTECMLHTSHSVQEAKSIVRRSVRIFVYRREKLLRLQPADIHSHALEDNVCKLHQDTLIDVRRSEATCKRMSLYTLSGQEASFTLKGTPYKGR